jgi:hypothetical protein
MTVTRRFQRVISADAHVMKPLDLWWKALGDRFGDRPPRPLHEYQGRRGTFFYTGYQGWPVSQIRTNTPAAEAAALGAEHRGLGELRVRTDRRTRSAGP